MIKKLLNKWKEEWWERHRESILAEYSFREESLMKELQSTLDEKKDYLNSSLKEVNDHSIELDYKKKDIQELKLRLDERKIELEEANDDLQDQLRMLEAKAHPSAIWTEAFTAGFNHAWNTMKPLVFENLERSKKLIHDMAVEETIRNNPQWRMNGYDKKNK